MTLDPMDSTMHTNIAGMRRGRLRIMADILRNAQNPAKKTHIMYECNLSFDQLKRYLNFLKKKALIEREIRSGSVIYQTTTYGQEFLRRYSRVLGLLRPLALKSS